MTVKQGFAAVQQHMYSEIKPALHPRFGAFPVIMEFETWLLADLAVQKYLRQQIPAPETIRHPAGELERVYHANNKGYSKISDGKTLAGMAHANNVYKDNCPHFNELADWLKESPAPKHEHSYNSEQQDSRWQQEQDELYQKWQQLEQDADLSLKTDPLRTEELLELADKAKAKYHAHVASYHTIFGSQNTG